MLDQAFVAVFSDKNPSNSSNYNNNNGGGGGRRSGGPLSPPSLASSAPSLFIRLCRVVDADADPQRVLLRRVFELGPRGHEVRKELPPQTEPASRFLQLMLFSFPRFLCLKSESYFQHSFVHISFSLSGCWRCSGKRSCSKHWPTRLATSSTTTMPLPPRATRRQREEKAQAQQRQGRQEQTQAQAQEGHSARTLTAG